VGTGEPLVTIDSHPDLVYSACWNWDGSQLVTTCRDKKIRLINPRTGAVEEVSKFELPTVKITDLGLGMRGNVGFLVVGC